MNTNTYLFEVTYTKNGLQDYVQVRASNKEGAMVNASKQIGDISILSVSRIGN